MASLDLVDSFGDLTVQDNEELKRPNRKSDWPLKVLIMNASDDSNDSKPEIKEGVYRRGDTPKKRRQTIKHIMNTHNPDLVLFQEFVMTQDNPLPENYEFIEPDEDSECDPCFVYNSDLEVCDHYQNTSLKNIKLPSKKLPPNIDIDPFTRMIARVISTAAEPSFKVICISWHGPNNKKPCHDGSLSKDDGPNNKKPCHGGSLSKDERTEYSEYLMEFLGNIREIFPKVPILVGGDFNIKRNKIESYIRSPFKLCEYEASKRRTKKGIIDYFIFTDDLELEDTEYIDLQQCDGADSVFNHDPIITSVKASTSSNTEAAM